MPNMAEPARVVDDAVDVVLECSGKAKAMEAGLGQLVRAGTLVLVGAGIERPRFDPNRILLNELVITGANTYDHDGFEQALDLLASGQAARSSTSSSARRCRSTACSTPCAAWPRAAPPERCWCGHDRVPRSRSRRGSTTSRCRCPPTRSTPTAAPRCRAFYGDVFGFEEYEDLTAGPPPARVPRPPPRAVHVPHRRGRADAGAPPRPLRHVGRVPRRLPGGPPPRRGVEGQGARRTSTSSSPRSRSTPGCSTSTASTCATASR